MHIIGRVLMFLLCVIPMSFLAAVSQTFFGAMVFVLCVWMIAAPTKNSVWWMSVPCFLYSVVMYDTTYVFFVGLMVSVYVFSTIVHHQFFAKKHNIFLYYILTFCFAFVPIFVVQFFMGYGVFSLTYMISIVGYSLVSFFLLYWGITFGEKCIMLYHRGDMKCHV